MKTHAGAFKGLGHVERRVTGIYGEDGLMLK